MKIETLHLTTEEIENSKKKLGFLNYIDIVCIDDIEPENQPWLWPGIIPLNAFTLFAGVGGLGKSQLLMFIAAAVSTGKPFRAGGLEHQLPQGSVLILSSEDSVKYALSPRLRALEADTSQIHVIKAVSNSAQPFKKRLMCLDEDLALLKAEIQRLQTVKLIIIDPIINFIGKTKDYINTEVSNFLYGLSDLAEEFGLSIILNKHLRKKDSAGIGAAVDEISGSHAWANTARQVWIICRDHEDKNKILFLDGKTNLKKQMSGMAFIIESSQIMNKKDEFIKTSRISWLDEVVNISADEAVNEEKYNKTKTQLAVDFIYDYLKKNGVSLLGDVIKMALLHGLKDRTIDRAVQLVRKEGRVKITKGVHPNRWWELKD